MAKRKSRRSVRSASAPFVRAAELDRFSADEVRQTKAWLDHEAAGPMRGRRVLAVRPRFLGAAPKGPRTTVVAMGDSWFDFPLGTDVLDCLANRHPVIVHRFGKRGDTLENMAYGSSPYEPDPLGKVIRAVHQHKPAAVLLSAGGNDIAGPELESYLNHSDSLLDDFRSDFAGYAVNTVFRRAYESMIERIFEAKPDIRVIAHGYGYPIPTGVGADVLIFRLAGPWLRPALIRKSIAPERGREILRELIDLLNEMLGSLVDRYPGRFRWIDLRGVIKAKDWRDELHLKNSVFAAVASRFAAEITAAE